jgi:hypothetical protein
MSCVHAQAGGVLVAMKKSVIISAFTPEANLKRKIRTHLRKLGFERTPRGALKPPSSSKETVRALHQEQRKAILKDQRRFLSEALPALSKHFADGNEVDPSKLLPRLEIIEAGTWQSDLFRMASLTWSVPVSAGFGRRLRYLVWDDNNKKLMGIIALGDPVFNLKVRDELIDWTVKDRGKRLINILDAYVLGAVPPYNMLLGGKLIACLVRSKEVREDFLKKYGETRGIISKKKKRAQLVMVTTSSSLGRSSVYNRLKLNEQKYFESLGYTQGWGHFHIPDTLFADLRAYLRRRRHKYVNGHKFGEGPNWRFRTIRAAFDALGLKADLLRHGIGREVFACSLAANAKNVLRGKVQRAIYRNLLSVHEVGLLARERWLVPRAVTRPEYKEWRREHLEELLSLKRRKAVHDASPASLAHKAGRTGT